MDDQDRLGDRLAIDDLLTRYTIAVDDEDFDLLDTVFLPEAVLDYTSAGGPRAPYPEVKAWLQTGLRRTHPARQHLIAQKQVLFDGDVAKVRAYFFNPFTIQAEGGAPAYSLGGGYYNHKLVRRPEGWRSIELFELRVWRQGLPPRPHPHAARSDETWDFGAPPSAARNRRRLTANLTNNEGRRKTGEMDPVSKLLERAREATSLSDFGEESFREGLEKLVDSGRRQGRLHERGRAVFEGQIVALLSRRLEVEHWYALHPEIDEQEIVAPVIGLGLPRTGSTAFSCLLAEDPAARSIRYWEADAPCPPPDAATLDTDPRVAAGERRLAEQLAFMPELKGMLPLSATGPMECQNFMAYDFKSNTFAAVAELPDYLDWLYHRADLRPTYRYLKRVLKLLQWRCPPRAWRLKNPAHMLFIEALDEVFPDARYWMTHRDVAQVIPSITHLYGVFIGGLSDQVDRGYIARLNQDSWELGLRRTLAFRDAGHEARFFDVRFNQFQQDPFPTLEALYRFLGEPFSAQARSRVQAWRDARPRDNHGRHEHWAEDFGIDIPALRQRFSFYSDRFAVGAAA